MIEELTFGKNGTEFVISQNISLDNLIEGKPVEREYELVLFNTGTQIKEFPEIRFNPWIIGEKKGGIAALRPEVYSESIQTKDFLEVMMAVTGSAFGYSIGDLTGAIFGVLFGGAVSKQISKKYKSWFDHLAKDKEARIVETIKGLNLNYVSRGLLNLDDNLMLHFGVCKYFNKILGADKSRSEIIESGREILDLIEDEIKYIQNNGNLSSQQDVGFLLGVLRIFYLAFHAEDEQVFLHNKIKIESKFSQINRSGWFDRGCYLGSIYLEPLKGYKPSKDDLKKQTRNALQNKNYFLENSFVINLRNIVSNRNESSNLPFGSLILPFYLWEKETHLRTYGFLQINEKNSEIESVEYINIF